MAKISGGGMAAASKHGKRSDKHRGGRPRGRGNSGRRVAASKLAWRRGVASGEGVTTSGNIRKKAGGRWKGRW